MRDQVQRLEASIDGLNVTESAGSTHQRVRVCLRSTNSLQK